MYLLRSDLMNSHNESRIRYKVIDTLYITHEITREHSCPDSIDNAASIMHMNYHHTKALLLCL